MTYALFLLIFLGIPIAIMAALTVRDLRQKKALPSALRNLPAWIPVAVHILVAVVYTTPWDNYLVATRVWYYDPQLVAGITLGWVPVEEYTFFVLQTLLAGLWLLFLARRIHADPLPGKSSLSLRRNSALALGVIWLASAGLLLSGWAPGRYLSLILVWALPPVTLQAAFGADILWRNRRLVALTLASMTTYLAITDSLAIASGTWTIDPRQSLAVFLAGVLPLEELLFFFMTNVLVVFGITLALDTESRMRARTFIHAHFVRPHLQRQDLELD